MNNSPQNHSKERELFGQMLQSARLVTGLSVLQLSEKTKVSADFIDSIENGISLDEQMPVYRRGFIKLLCKGLDVNELDYLEAYDRAYPANQDRQLSIEEVTKIQKKTGSASLLSSDRKANILLRSVHAIQDFMISIREQKVRSGEESHTSQAQMGRDNDRRFELRMRYVTLPLTAILLVAIGVFFFGERDSDKPEVIAIAPEKNEVVPPLAEKQPTLPLEQVVEGVEKEKVENESVVDHSKTATSKPQNVVSELVEVPNGTDIPNEHTESPQQLSQEESLNVSDSAISIFAKEEVIIKIRKDEETRVVYNLQSGDLKNLDFAQDLQLLIMDASAVDVSFQGKSLGSLGKKGRVRRITFSHRNPDEVVF